MWKTNLVGRIFVLFALIYLSFMFSSCTSSTSDNSIDIKTDSLPDGTQLYMENCAACHGRDGTLRKAGSKDLSEITLNFAEIKQVVELGTAQGMPRFKEILKTQENIEAVTSHVLGFQRIKQPLETQAFEK